MIDPGSGIVAVTGASGYIGSHIVRELLERGHSVRACVRDPDNPAKTEHLSALTAGNPGTLDFARGDLLEPGSYDAAFADVVAVIHAAAAVKLAAPNPQRDIIEPSITGTTNVLASIAKTPSIKRLVHTTSVAAIVSRPDSETVYTEEDWHDATAKSDPYGYAKREAERLVADFPQSLDRALSVVFINPALVIGPVMTKAHAKASPSTLRDIVSSAFPALPQLHFGLVDVREVATAHVEALERPGASGRHILCADSQWMQEIAKTLAGQFPELKIKTGRLPNFMLYISALFDKRLSLGMLKNLLGRTSRFDNSRSKTQLGITYRPLAESVKDCAQSMIDQGFVRVKRR